VLSLVVLFGGGGGGTVVLLRRQRTILAGPTTPFHPDSLLGTGPDGLPAQVPPRPSVVLYVSEGCAFCKAELRAWSRLLAAHPGRRPPWVVFAPGTEVRSARALAGAFSGRWMLDPTGAVGRSLQVQAVPMAVVLDSSGAVVEAHVGMSPPERLARLAALASPTPRRGP
jgi:hypothetical protein